ncbi:hypothetical protein [Azospirillum thermophilum]|uniref:Uncharacterized protein n=1 Tax=Azospirillum thermophilum TaxID=2202148 RepID=A0A2S2CKN9_9PROT|nr:hypothetical protein [Azospirillum thermophilum]AWK85061.1 hypothetical protein DEW08_01655 [Azospirillum thermophilum]
MEAPAAGLRRPNTSGPRPVARLPTRPGETRYFRTRLVKGGPWVPASVSLIDGDRDPVTWELMSDQQLTAEVDGRPVPCDGWEPRGWPWHPIDEAEYRHLRDTADWARRYAAVSPEAASHPLANPRQPIDRAVAPIF